MIVLGLTGSIGMGKSTAARLLRRLGIPVHDADAVVHRLMAPGGKAVPAIAAAFPGTVGDGGVDRAALGRRVFGDAAALRRLEGIIHPLVRAEESKFLARWRRARRRLVVLDIPLLFETGGDRRCDAVVVVTAPPFLQTQRVLRRPGMTPARLESIRRQQMADGEKRRRADFVVQTGIGRRHTLRRLVTITRALATREPPACGRPSKAP